MFLPLFVCGSVFGPYFIMHYLVSFLALQSSSRGRDSWFLYFNCLPGVMRLLVFFVSSSSTLGWSAVFVRIYKCNIH